MLCTKCGKENKDTSKFCKTCGAPLEAIDIEIKEKYVSSEPEMIFEKTPELITADKVKSLKYGSANDEDWEYQALQAFHRGGFDREQAFGIYKSHKD